MTSMGEHRQSPYDHEHVAEHRDTDGIYHLYETPANHPKWANSWRPETNEEHEHEWHSPLDFVHDHERGPHHHHISVIDSAAGILYWLPSDHPKRTPPPPEGSRRNARDEWVRHLMENLLPVTPLGDV